MEYNWIISTLFNEPTAIWEWKELEASLKASEKRHNSIKWIETNNFACHHFFHYLPIFIPNNNPQYIIQILFYPISAISSNCIYGFDVIVKFYFYCHSSSCTEPHIFSILKFFEIDSPNKTRMDICWNHSISSLVVNNFCSTVT